MLVLNRIPSFGELTRQNIHKFKTRVNIGANSILQTGEKYIIDSSRLPCTTSSHYCAYVYETPVSEIKY